MHRIHFGVLYTRVREDEKLLLEELRDRGHEVTKVDVREPCFHLDAVSTTSCIIGIGWGRASRARTLAEIATPSPAEEPGPEVTTGALKASPAEGGEGVAASPTVGELARGEVPDPDKQHASGYRVPGVGEEDPEELSAESLFDPAATARIVTLWIITPTMAVVGSYALFSLLA